MKTTLRYSQGCRRLTTTPMMAGKAGGVSCSALHDGSNKAYSLKKRQPAEFL